MGANRAVTVTHYMSIDFFCLPQLCIVKLAYRIVGEQIPFRNLKVGWCKFIVYYDL